MSNSKSNHCKLKVCECEKEGLIPRSRAAFCLYCAAVGVTVDQQPAWANWDHTDRFLDAEEDIA